MIMLLVLLHRTSVCILLRYNVNIFFKFPDTNRAFYHFYWLFNGLLYNGQYGFCENMSTQHAILDIVHSIQSNMDNKLFTCGIFLDFKKAFDTVDHSILVSKLYHYGIRGPVNEWFSSYLNGRVQTTQIGKQISSERNVLTGVPQGSVLGPLLFLIYINDIHNSSEKLSFYLFADDTDQAPVVRRLDNAIHRINRYP